MENQITKSQNKTIKITYILCYVALAFVVALWLYVLIQIGTESLPYFLLGFLPNILIFIFLIVGFSLKNKKRYFIPVCLMLYATFMIVNIINSLARYIIAIVTDFSVVMFMNNTHLILQFLSTILLAVLLYHLFKRLKGSHPPTKIINKIYGAVVITFLFSCVYYLLLQSWGFLSFGGLLGLLPSAFIDFFISFILYKSLKEEGFYYKLTETP